MTPRRHAHFVVFLTPSIVLLTALGMSSRRIGLIGTASTG